MPKVLGSIPASFDTMASEGTAVKYTKIAHFIIMKKRCGYITMFLETHASENGICFTQQMFQIMILFHNGSTLKKIKVMKV
jgi:hypothetical protein